MTVLVFGARGNVGGAVVSTLAGRGVPVRAASRGTSARTVPPGVDTVTLDITEPRGAAAALDGVDTIFLYPTRPAGPERLLAAAAAAGVSHVVLLSSPGSWDAGEHDRIIGRVHQSVERAVAESAIPYTVLYPGWLASNARRDWGAQIRAHDRVRLAFPDSEVNPTHIDDIAEVAADLLTRDRFRGRMQVITGPRSMRLRDVVDTLADALGRPIGLEEQTPDQARDERPSWIPEEVLETLLHVTEAAVGVPALVNNNVERITGHPARPFHQWATEHRDDFTTG